MFSAALIGIGLVVTVRASKRSLQRPWISRAALGLVDHAPHLASHEVRRHEDAAGAAHVEHLGEHVVVAGEQVEAVDRRQVLVAGLLHGRHVLDLRQLGQQVVRACPTTQRQGML